MAKNFPIEAILKDALTPVQVTRKVFIGTNTEKLSFVAANLQHVYDHQITSNCTIAASRIFENFDNPHVLFLLGPLLTIKDILEDQILSDWILNKYSFEIILFDQYYFDAYFKMQIHLDIIMHYDADDYVHMNMET